MKFSYYYRGENGILRGLLGQTTKKLGSQALKSGILEVSLHKKSEDTCLLALITTDEQCDFGHLSSTPSIK